MKLESSAQMITSEIRKESHVGCSPTGVFAEPTASATLAGLLRAREEGIVRASDRVLLVVTGNGLKDVAGASAKAPPAHRIGVSLDDVARVLSNQARA